MQINLLNCIYPLSIALCMRIVQRISNCIGRAQASSIAFLLNAICFCLLSRMGNLRILLGLFLVRGGLANGAIPIDRSIVMDFVPSADRGKWNAVESFTSMTWCGSAFLGGYLADAHDYRFTFVISAVLYFASLAAYLPLLWLVPREDRRFPTAPLLGSPGIRSPARGFGGAVPYAEGQRGPLDDTLDLGVSLQAAQPAAAP